MPTVPLPDDPDLGQLRKQARDLQTSVRAAWKGSLDLVAELHPDGAPADPGRWPLHAAHLVLARLYGFPSWPALVRHVGIVTEYRRVPDTAPPSADPATEFLRRACLTFGPADGPLQAGAAAVLAEHPGIARGDVWVAAARADVDAGGRLLAADPALAVREGGPHRWPPIAYLAFARHDPPPDRDAVVATARLLLDHGADPDTGYLWHGLPSPFTLLTGAFGGGEGGQPPHPHGPALARVLLEAGADPNDAQTLYNRMFTPADDHLELLLEFGLGRGAGGPWRRRLGDALDSPAGMVHQQLDWAVTHGLVARVQLLAGHGADLRAPLSGRYGVARRPPYVVALTSGRFAVAELLERLGAAEPLEPEERVVAAVLAGDRAVDPDALARARAARPGLVVWASVAAGSDAVRLAVDLGWDVDALARTDVPSDQEWETALHRAAHTGNAELVRLLLDLGADPDVRDARFDGTPADWAEHGGHAELVSFLRGRGRARPAQ
ncbi:MAG: ankyrin repeat domain-containing protein [Pseudonocardia sp.]|nr:ankyrin repeat domain-containing protein [Pseudonocardia sp.]